MAETTDRGYSSINAARAALGYVIPSTESSTFGKHRNVTLLLKGVGNQRPQSSKTTTTWDPATVLDFIKDNPPRTRAEHGSKLATLLLLASAQRGHTIHGLRTDHMDLYEDRVVFHVNHLNFKQARRTIVVPPLTFPALDEEPALCIVRTVRACLREYEGVRGTNTALFLSSIKPHAAISRDTLTRWVGGLLARAGVNMDTYTAGSVRAASTSAALRRGLPLDQVLKLGGWSNEHTFKRFYLKPLSTDEEVGQA